MPLEEQHVVDEVAHILVCLTPKFQCLGYALFILV